MIRILVVDNHDVVRDGLCEFLAAQAGIEVAARASNGHAAMLLLNDGLEVNFVLTDIHMPHMDGIELTRQIAALDKGVNVIVLTFYSHPQVKQRVLAAGAKECLSKDGDLEDLLTAIRTVHAGRLGLFTDQYEYRPEA
jgi:DNA-binding NarL/FixJ family response regulator